MPGPMKNIIWILFLASPSFADSACDQAQDLTPRVVETENGPVMQVSSGLPNSDLYWQEGEKKVPLYNTCRRDVETPPSSAIGSQKDVDVVQTINDLTTDLSFEFLGKVLLAGRESRKSCLWRSSKWTLISHFCAEENPPRSGAWLKDWGGYTIFSNDLSVALMISHFDNVYYENFQARGQGLLDWTVDVFNTEAIKEVLDSWNLKDFNRLRLKDLVKLEGVRSIFFQP